ncbi:non-classical arabinogalactan protein 30-like [Oryza glaberrima]|nr:non-classical arabinogalactan protein 30-like [Oryza glaberrima]
MAAFQLPLAILVSLLATGATANYGYTTPSPSPPPPQQYTPPAHSDKLLVKVEGMVYCQSCAQRNTHSLEGAKPLPKAEVSVICHDANNRVMVRCRRAVANDNGYFIAELNETKVSDFYMGDPRKACYVRLRASPDFECNNPTNINYSSIEGAPLRDEGKRWADHGYYNVMYATGPLAFRPAICPPKH